PLSCALAMGFQGLNILIFSTWMISSTLVIQTPCTNFIGKEGLSGFLKHNLSKILDILHTFKCESGNTKLSTRISLIGDVSINPGHPCLFWFLDILAYICTNTTFLAIPFFMLQESLAPWELRPSLIGPATETTLNLEFFLGHEEPTPPHLELASIHPGSWLAIFNINIFHHG
ncbi:hypothetical protein ACJX0J_022070, partial [Zea mays]